MSGEAPNYDEIDQLEIERLIVDDLGCGSPQDARYKLDLIIGKLADVTKDRDALRESLDAFIERFHKIRWGRDGDCGAAALVDDLEAAIDAAKGGK